MSAIKANKQQIGLDILPSKNVVLSTNTSNLKHFLELGNE